MKRALALILIFLFVLAALPRFSNASKDEPSPFSLELIFPENNIGDVGCYHIPGTPGEKIILQAKLTNLTDQPLEIKAVPMNSYSGPKGIFYQEPDKVNSELFSLSDESYGAAQYIAIKDVIILQPKQFEYVDINVNIPQIDSGVLLGSVKFVVFDGKQKVETLNQDNKSTVLLNIYQGNNTGIMIDLPKKEETDIKVKEPQFYYDTRNLGIKISNEAAILEENISGRYQIKDKQNNIIYEGNIETFRMAPMTAFYYMIPWGDKEFVQDLYTVYMELNADGRPIDFEIPLATVKETTEPETSNVTNENTGSNNGSQALSGNVASQNLTRTIFIIGLVVVIIIFAFLIYKSYKKSKRSKRYRES